MKYWKETESMNVLKSTAIGLFIFFGAMFWIEYNLEKQILETTNMTINDVLKMSAIPDNNLGNIFVSIIIGMFIISTVMYFFGKYKLKNNY